MNHLYAYMERSTHRAARTDPSGEPIRFIASTEGVARDGMVIEAAGWDVTNYRNNPAVLWAHDLLGARPPIGRAVDVFVEKKQLIADIEFDQDDDFARTIESKYRNGFLNAVSVGWDTREFAPPKAGGAPRVTKAELLEISAVPVGSDPGALKTQQVHALRALADDLAYQGDAALDDIAALHAHDARARAVAEYARWYRLRVLGGLPIIGRRA